MGLTHIMYLEEDVLYKCSCETHLSHHNYIESKNYHSSTGIAYLFTKV